MILDSLHYWVEEMHVDGFRFDLAAILSRDELGRPLESPPVLWDIDSDPILAGTKLIAEAWDAAGLYQVGSFIGDSWKEWNGKFRDDVRSFVKSDRGAVPRVCCRLFGSPDIYEHEGREPEQSVNFVTCHDGFTLNDLVSYNSKHNEPNGEGNRDGSDFNLSWNCGVESPSDDPAVEELRNRQVKNFLAITLLSIGTPMLLMGDEVRRTQRGNNNPYCQDDETSWFDWDLVARHRDVFRFLKSLIASRARSDTAAAEFDKTLSDVLREARIRLHGVRLNQPDMSDDSHSVAFSALSPRGRLTFYMILNAYWEALDFELPEIPPGSPHRWLRRLDTSLASPDDVCAWSCASAVEGPTYRAAPRSVVLLFHFNTGN
jgi:isoamylase